MEYRHDAAKGWISTEFTQWSRTFFYVAAKWTFKTLSLPFEVTSEVYATKTLASLRKITSEVQQCRTWFSNVQHAHLSMQHVAWCRRRIYIVVVVLIIYNLTWKVAMVFRYSVWVLGGGTLRRAAPAFKLTVRAARPPRDARRMPSTACSRPVLGTSHCLFSYLIEPRQHFDLLLSPLLFTAH